MSKTKTSLELLAPAGSVSSFEAALEEGADAIYVGAPGFNARSLTRDFSFPEIGKMIKTAHESGVRVYVAMNSLVKEDEISQAVEALAYFEELKPDALIIQDLGLYYLASRYFSDIPLHASTLMHGHNGMAVNSLGNMGFKRVVLPRELTLEEIRKINKTSHVELEVFVHGAMCFSFSGLCLFSSMHGGKSSLRGQCVQPCRRRYSLVNRKGRGGRGKSQEKGGGYLFSMNDLSGIELLHRLEKSGVKCLKLEGRLKSAEYVRNTVKAYRIMLDTLNKNAKERQQAQVEAQLYLDKAMGRRRSSGFFLSDHPDKAITPHLSGNVGKMVGRVTRLEFTPAQGRKKNAAIRVSLREPIQSGERFRLHDERSGERVSFTVRSMKIGNRPVRQAKSGQVVTLYVQHDFPRLSVKNFEGTLFRVDIGSSAKGTANIRLEMSKTEISVKPVHAKVKNVLKQLPGHSNVEGKFIKNHDRAKRGSPLWWVRINSFRDMHFRLPVRPVKYVLPITSENIEQAVKMTSRNKNSADRVVWSLPPVIMEQRTEFYFQAVKKLVETGYCNFMLGHFTQKELFANISASPQPIRIYGDYTLNLLNSFSLAEASEAGLSGGLFSIESDAINLAGSLHGLSGVSEMTGVTRKEFSVGIYVYGFPPLFTSRLDDKRYKYGRKVTSPRGEEYTLSSVDDITIARSAIPFSIMDWRKDMAKIGADYFYADLTGSNFRKSAAEFIALYSRKGKRPSVMTGNYTGGLV